MRMTLYLRCFQLGFFLTLWIIAVNGRCNVLCIVHFLLIILQTPKFRNNSTTYSIYMWFSWDFLWKSIGSKNLSKLQ